MSCSDGDSGSSPLPVSTDQPLVCSFYGINGLGDLTFADTINSGISFAESELDFFHVSYSPASWTEAEENVNFIFNEIKNKNYKKVLCFFADQGYLSILEKNEIFKEGLPSVTSLMFDTPRSEIPESISDKLYTIFIPYYAACYGAGILMKKICNQYNDGFVKPLIILPNDTCTDLFKSSQFFLKGMGIEAPETISQALEESTKSDSENSQYYYWNLTEKISEITTSDTTSSGFDKADYLYKLAKSIEIKNANSSHEMMITSVLPLCGGSGMGLLHFAQENTPLTFSIIGVDVNMDKYAADDVPFSIIKNSYRISLEFVTSWYENTLKEKDQVLRFEDNYTSISFDLSADEKVFGQNTTGFRTDELEDEIYNAAIEMERKILGEKN